MAEFRVSFETDNAAFEDDGADEVARLLREAAALVGDGHTNGKCRDINGNTVGHWSWT